jgi:hypothetical protein
MKKLLLGLTLLASMQSFAVEESGLGVFGQIFLCGALEAATDVSQRDCLNDLNGINDVLLESERSTCQDSEEIAKNRNDLQAEGTIGDIICKTVPCARLETESDQLTSNDFNIQKTSPGKIYDFAGKIGPIHCSIYYNAIYNF